MWRLLNPVGGSQFVMGDPLQYKPTEERKHSWLATTGTPFDPLEALTQLSYHNVSCPRCSRLNATGMRPGCLPSVFAAKWRRCRVPEARRYRLRSTRLQMAMRLLRPPNHQDRAGDGQARAGHRQELQRCRRDNGRVSPVRAPCMSAVHPQMMTR